MINGWSGAGHIDIMDKIDIIDDIDKIDNIHKIDNMDHSPSNVGQVFVKCLSSAAHVLSMTAHIDNVDKIDNIDKFESINKTENIG